MESARARVRDGGSDDTTIATATTKIIYCGNQLVDEVRGQYRTIRKLDTGHGGYTNCLFIFY